MVIFRSYVSLPEGSSISLPLFVPIFFKDFPAMFFRQQSIDTIYRFPIGFKGKSTGNPWFSPSNVGVSCKFSRHPIM